MPVGWNVEAVTAVRALPRRTNPDGPTGEPQPRRNADQTAEEDLDARADGANLGDTECDSGENAPRKLKLTRRLFDKFGYTDNCAGCFRKEAGLPGNHGKHIAQ